MQRNELGQPIPFPPDMESGIDAMNGGIDAMSAKAIGQSVTKELLKYGKASPGAGGSGSLIFGPTATLAPGASTAGNQTFQNTTNDDIMVQRIIWEQWVSASGVIATPGGTLVNSIQVGGVGLVFGLRGVPISMFGPLVPDWPNLRFLLKGQGSVVCNILNGPLVSNIDGGMIGSPV